jgi:elongation factor P
LSTVSTNDLKNNMTLALEDGLFVVLEFQHVKPGKGHAFVRTKLKNLKTGAVIDRTFRADEKVEQAELDKRPAQLLYRTDSAFVFMDMESYEQVEVPAEVVGDRSFYLKDGDEATLVMYDGTIVAVELPTSVALRVAHTEPGVQGDRVSGARKPAELETGLQVQVPLFINTGDVVKVDTRTGEYLGKA